MPETIGRNDNMSFYPYFADANQRFYHKYMLPAVFKILDGLELSPSDREVFDLGCGNGAAAVAMIKKGYNVIGVDPGGKESNRQSKRILN